MVEFEKVKVFGAFQVIWPYESVGPMNMALIKDKK